MTFKNINETLQKYLDNIFTFFTKITNNLLKLGVIVRQLNAFGLSNYIRVSIGLQEENIQFIKCLKKVI